MTWDSFNQDNIGPDYSVLNSEVFLIQRLLSTQTWCPEFRGVLPGSEVPLKYTCSGYKKLSESHQN